MKAACGCAFRSERNLEVFPSDPYKPCAGHVRSFENTAKTKSYACDWCKRQPAKYVQLLGTARDDVEAGDTRRGWELLCAKCATQCHGFLPENETGPFQEFALCEIGRTMGFTVLPLIDYDESNRLVIEESVPV